MAHDRYILMPRRGLLATGGPAFDTLVRMPQAASTRAPVFTTLDAFGITRLEVIDTARENGPKLVQLEPAEAARLNAADSPLRAVREVFYPLPEPADGTIDPNASNPNLAGHPFDVEVVDAASGAPIPGCDVIAFSSVANRAGMQGITNHLGIVRMTLSTPTIERIVARPAPTVGYWSAYRTNVPANGRVQLAVQPLVLPYRDSVQHYYGASSFDASRNVVVGVVDTGCGPHSELNIVGGRNTVTGEAASDTLDGQYHGTHVAGLIGARGGAPGHVRGVAPNAKLRAYRVFGAGSNGASNYAILKALIFAAEDRCDIVNLSLGGGPHNEVVEEAIADARNQGMLVVISAGNNYRAVVSYPAAYPGAMAVSAMGREGSFPAGSGDELQVVRPPYATADATEFIAHFSNVGTRVAVTGIGVGTISTLPANRYGPLSGTSMAAPTVAGAAACLLSHDSVVYGMPRDRARSDAIERLVQTNCIRRGFGLIYEGYGLPQVPQPNPGT